MLYVSYILQFTVFQNFLLLGSAPNFIVITVCFMSILYGDIKGIFIGFFAGLLIDIFSGTTLGLYALILSFTGYANSKLSAFVFSDDMKLPVTAVFCSDFIYGFLSFVCLFLIQGNTNFMFFLFTKMMPEMIYTTAVSIVIFPFVNKLFMRYMRPIRESEINFASGSKKL